jgi:hypothetical protein
MGLRHADESGGKWWYLGGTGSFERLEGGGTYQLALEWPDGKVLATWEGTASIKLADGLRLANERPSPDRLASLDP